MRGRKEQDQNAKLEAVKFGVNCRSTATASAPIPFEAAWTLAGVVRKAIRKVAIQKTREGRAEKLFVLEVGKTFTGKLEYA